jgi:hypothetical protein
MRTAHGIYRDGLIILDTPVNWPEGSRVTVNAEVLAGLAEADWPDSPETRSVLLARLDALEPFDLTPAEEREIAAARESVRQASLRRVRQQMGLAP